MSSSSLSCANRCCSSRDWFGSTGSHLVLSVGARQRKAAVSLCLCGEKRHPERSACLIGQPTHVIALIRAPLQRREYEANFRIVFPVSQSVSFDTLSRIVEC